jgi:hypothetical protein
VHREAQSQHHAVGSIDVGAASPSRRLLDVASRLSVVVIVGQLSARRRVLCFAQRTRRSSSHSQIVTQC